MSHKFHLLVIILSLSITTYGSTQIIDEVEGRQEKTQEDLSIFQQLREDFKKGRQQKTPPTSDSELDDLLIFRELSLAFMGNTGDFPFYERLQVPFGSYIREASEIFKVPPYIIQAVIVRESSGNPLAKAKTSSASGLMQLTRGTWKSMKNILRELNISFKDDVFDPRSNILAGSAYLARMFDVAAERGLVSDAYRYQADHWRAPLTYYYAGPHYKNKIRVVNGKEVIVYSDKTAVNVSTPGKYSRLVLETAREIKSSNSARK